MCYSDLENWLVVIRLKVWCTQANFSLNLAVYVQKWPYKLVHGNQIGDMVHITQAGQF